MVVKSLNNFLGVPHHQKKLMENLCTMNTKNKIENIECKFGKFWPNLEKFTKLSKPQILEILEIIIFITNLGKKSFLDKFIKLLKPQK
jgi:hypothetical protein